MIVHGLLPFPNANPLPLWSVANGRNVAGADGFVNRGSGSVGWARLRRAPFRAQRRERSEHLFSADLPEMLAALAPPLPAIRARRSHYRRLTGAGESCAAPVRTRTEKVQKKSD